MLTVIEKMPRLALSHLNTLLSRLVPPFHQRHLLLNPRLNPFQLQDKLLAYLPSISPLRYNNPASISQVIKELLSSLSPATRTVATGLRQGSRTLPRQRRSHMSHLASRPSSHISTTTTPRVRRLRANPSSNRRLIRVDTPPLLMIRLRTIRLMASEMLTRIATTEIMVNNRLKTKIQGLLSREQRALSAHLQPSRLPNSPLVKLNHNLRAVTDKRPMHRTVVILPRTHRLPVSNSQINHTKCTSRVKVRVVANMGNILTDIRTMLVRTIRRI